MKEELKEKKFDLGELLREILLPLFVGVICIPISWIPYVGFWLSLLIVFGFCFAYALLPEVNWRDDLWTTLFVVGGMWLSAYYKTGKPVWVWIPVGAGTLLYLWCLWRKYFSIDSSNLAYSEE